MEYLKTAFGYQVRLETGEEIHKSLSKLMDVLNLQGGIAMGIGALSSYSLGYYDIHKKEYIRKDYNEEVELLSCIGNLAHKGDSKIAHLHATVSNVNMETRGGHLFEGIISATGEFSLIDSKVMFKRLDGDAALPLLNLTDK